jgi:hypothetical protein
MIEGRYMVLYKFWYIVDALYGTVGILSGGVNQYEHNYYF